MFNYDGDDALKEMHGLEPGYYAVVKICYDGPEGVIYVFKKPKESELKFVGKV